MASKKLKKLRKAVRKTLKKGGRALGTVLRVAAPVAPILLGGVGGLAAGAGASAVGAALKGGNRKKKLKAFKRAAVATSAAAAGTALLGMASGAGAGGSLLDSAKSIFGGGGTPQDPTTDLDNAIIPSEEAASRLANADQSGLSFDEMLMNAGGYFGNRQGREENQQSNVPRDETRDGGGGGGGRGDGFTGTREDLPADEQIDPETGEPIKKKSKTVWIVLGVGALALFMFMRGRKK